jgi:hypothetical protein
MKGHLYGLLALVLLCGGAWAQAPSTKTIVDQEQGWVGIMTNGRLSEKWGLWNDFHYVPGAFGVVRTGLSYRILPEMTLTGGYAQLWLSAPAEAGLPRAERRPWGQLVVNHKVSPRLFMANRIRYDMRYRQSLEQGLPAEGFDFNHRLRFLVSMRWPLKGYEIKGGTPFFNLSNEVLVNFGEQILTNHFDQNRLWATLGWQLGNLTLQSGYMLRYVQMAGLLQYQRNHTLLLWLTWNFDFRKQAQPDLLYRQP